MFKEIINKCNKNIVHIKNKDNVLKILSKIKSNGKDKLQIISDYDRTLTKAYIDGKRCPTSVGLLRENKYLTPDYSEKAFALYNKYYPIESDILLSLEYKKEMMQEWWEKHIDLMIKSGMSSKVIDDMISKYPKVFREKTTKLLKLLSSNNIPLLIFSAGFGNMIRNFLEYKKLSFRNIHVIANYLNFDKNGNATGYKGKIIHVFNKSEININNPSYKEETKNRKNIILLGDSTGDVGMADGINYENIIKIGFLNDNIEKKLEIYKNAYDIVITNDGSMELVYDIIEEII